jgi:putative ABC transport system permease protein
VTRVFREFVSRVGALFAKCRHDGLLDEEIQTHLSLLIDENVRRGMSPLEARAAARREFGGLDQVKETYRDQRGWPFLDALAQDVRYAIRTLGKNRGFTAVAVLTLGLGIGANTAIFTLVDALMLRLLPVHNPHELVRLTRVQGGAPEGENFSYPQVRALAEHDELFSGLGGFSGETFNVGPPDALVRTGGAWVSGGFYQTLGLEPAAGRLLRPDDDRPGAAPAAVISDSYWARRFGRDVAAIGRPLLIEGVPVTVVGVSAAGFAGAIVGEAADITLALNVLPQLQPERPNFLGPGARWLRVLARPRAGMPMDQVRARAAAVWTQILNATVPPNMPAEARRRAMASSIDVKAGENGSSSLRTEFRQPLLVLMAVVGLVLLIACANVANLLLARATARQREIAVRLAIGAGRGRLVRQLLTESALLSAAGAALGIVVASVGSEFLVALISTGPTLPTASDTIALDLSLNWHVLAFTGLVAVSTTMLFGLAPAIKATVVTPVLAMTATGSRVTASRGRLAPSLVTAQVSISLLLLIGAGLFVRTLQNLRTLDRGFHHEGVLLVDVDGRRAGYRGPRARAFYQQVLAISERVPGVTVASFSSVTPLLGGGISMGIALNGQPISGEEIHFNLVAPRYFETMRTPVVLGREFTSRDDEAAPGVAIVNEAFVRRYMPIGNPLGQRVSVVGPRDSEQSLVVGVVRDAVYETLRQAPPPTVYVPYLHRGSDPVTFEIYAVGSLAQVASAIRSEVQPKLPGTPLRIRTLTAQLETSLVQERLMASLATSFGVLALVLAGVGLYGLLAYTVARRTNEIGIRVALGAERSQMLWLMMNDALQMIAWGTAIGLLAAWAASRLISSMLFGLTGTDPSTVAGATGLLVLVGALAGFLPARRASAIDPMVALRHE